MDLKTTSCIEAKLKVNKFIESYEKSSPVILSYQYILDQLDVLDHIEEALMVGFHDPELTEQCDQLSIKMWRNVIYPQIDYIRRILSTSTAKDEAERRSLAQQLDTIVLGHLGRLSQIISRFTVGKRDIFESDAFLVGEFEDNQRKLLVRILIFSGDLIRYRSSNNNIFNSYDRFESSREFYELGHRVDPMDGSIFNQLAVIESLSPNKSVPMMIYLYSRALGSIEPFPVARENLLRLLKKFGGLFGCLLGILDGHEPSSLSLTELLDNHPGEDHLLYASALALGKYLNIIIPKVIRKDNPLISILNQSSSDINTENLDMKFLSTLIGSSFIDLSVQRKILNLFNPEIPEIVESSGSVKPPSQHEAIQLPLSQ